MDMRSLCSVWIKTWWVVKCRWKDIAAHVPYMYTYIFIYTHVCIDIGLKRGYSNDGAVEGGGKHDIDDIEVD